MYYIYNKRLIIIRKYPIEYYYNYNYYYFGL